jgi:hypothetical protein
LIPKAIADPLLQRDQWFGQGRGIRSWHWSSGAGRG